MPSVRLLGSLDCKKTTCTSNHMPPFDGILDRHESSSERKKVETKKRGKTEYRKNDEDFDNRLHVFSF